MLPDFVVAASSTSFLVVFSFINIHNVVRKKSVSREPLTNSSTRATEGAAIYLATFGTLVFAVCTVLFPFVVFTGFLSFVNCFPFRILFPLDSVVQVGGLILLSSGYVLFSWSVISRGRYAVSWDMPQDHKLVTWGPYRYVRHPSYLGYFLMFLGLVLTWTNLLAVPSLIAVPGYVAMIDKEEKFLIERFGDEYRQYQERTGRLFPRLGKR